MARIVVVGSLNMDLVAVALRLPQGGETLLGTQFLSEPGGKGANQAYAAAKLNGDVAMLGRVGSDDHGVRLRATLEAVGCDVTGVGAVEGHSGVAVIFVAESGENSIVVVPGANRRFAPGDLEHHAQCLAEAQFVLLQLETPMETVMAAARLAKQHGASVILDPAPAPDALPAELLHHVDILTPNETEAARILGVSNPLSSFSSTDPRDVARALQGTGVRTVILKLGARGCLLADGDVVMAIPTPRVDVVDTTAAGDVFNGALAVACSEGASLAEACRFAACAAALSVRHLGAQRSMPGREELDAFLGDCT